MIGMPVPEAGGGMPVSGLSSRRANHSSRGVVLARDENRESQRLKRARVVRESGGNAVIGLDESAELSAADRSVTLWAEVRIEDAIANAAPPMRARIKVMVPPNHHNVIHLSEGDNHEVVETFVFALPHKSFGERVRLRRPNGNPQCLHAHVVPERSEFPSDLRVMIHQNPAGLDALSCIHMATLRACCITHFSSGLNVAGLQRTLRIPRCRTTKTKASNRPRHV